MVYHLSESRASLFLIPESAHSPEAGEDESLKDGRPGLDKRPESWSYSHVILYTEG